MPWSLPPPSCKVASSPIYPSLRQAPGESSGCAASAEGHRAEQGERGAQRPQPSPSTACHPTATRMCLGSRGHPQPPKCPVPTNCWAKSNSPPAAFPAGSRAAAGVAAVEQAKHPPNPLFPRQMLRQGAARMPRDTSPAVFLCLLTITGAHFNRALQFFAYNAFFSAESLFLFFQC